MIRALDLTSFATATVGGGKKASWTGTDEGAALNVNQQQPMMQLEERDADFDRQLDEIAEALQDIVGTAERQGDEVALQTQVLDRVVQKNDKNVERMGKCSNRMKKNSKKPAERKIKLQAHVFEA